MCQAVLHGVPLTGRQLLRQKRVILALKRRVRGAWQSGVKLFVVVPSGLPPKHLITVKKGNPKMQRGSGCGFFIVAGLQMGLEELSLFLSFVSFSVFFALLCFSSIFLLILQGQGQRTAICRRHWEFHSDPVCTDPAESFPNEALEGLHKHPGNGSESKSWNLPYQSIS